MRKPDTASGDRTTLARNGASVMLVMWFVFAFALFSFMGTKFHHYIFPAVPPIAMLVGIVLDDMLGKTDTSSPRFALFGVAMGAALAACVVLLTWSFGGNVWGDKGKGLHPVQDKWMLGIAIAVEVIAILLAMRFKKPAIVVLEDDEAQTDEEAERVRKHEN